MSVRRQLAWATSLSLVGSVVMVALSYPRNLLIARALGPGGLGVLALAVTIAGWATMLFGLGLHSSVSKYASEHRSDGPVLRGGATWALRFGLVTGSAGALLIAGVGFAAGSELWHDPEVGIVLAIVLLSVPASIVTYIASGICLGVGDVRSNVVVNNILQPVLSTGMVVVIAAADLGLHAVAWVISLSSIGAAAVAWARARRAVGRGETRLAAHAPRAILAVGTTLGASSLANVVWLKLDVVFLSAFWGTTQAGLYAPAYQTAYLLTYMIVAISSLFAPSVAAQVASEKFEVLARLYAETTRWCFYGNMTLAVTLFCGADPFLSFFGSQYATADTVLTLRILLVFFLAHSVFGSMATNLLAMGGSHRVLAVIETVMVPIALILHLTVTRSYGITGAAIASGSAMALVSLFVPSPSDNALASGASTVTCGRVVASWSCQGRARG